MPPTRPKKTSNLDDVPENLSSDTKLIIQTVERKIEEMKADFENLRREFNDRLDKKNLEILRLSDDNFLRDRITKLENTMDEEDAYVRRDTIIISGNSVPEVTSGEICSDLAVHLIKDKLKLQLRETDISVAHRLGKKPTNQVADKRSIMVKLCRRDTKRDILTARRNLTVASEPSFFINESLTPKRRTILYALRQMKKAHPSILASCSSFDGRVYAYTKPLTPSHHSTTGRPTRHLVNTHSSLVEFCRTYIKKPLDTFLESWDH